MKVKKNIEEIAKEIWKAEQEISLGKNVKNNEKKIEVYMSRLSLGEILEIDDYIMSNLASNI